MELTSLGVQEAEGIEEKLPEVPEELRVVMEQFVEVFKMPHGLPPQHQIVLKNGANPIIIRPYRYPQIQKEETKRMVTDMMRARIIQPTCSPFSSAVLLVK